MEAALSRNPIEQLYAILKCQAGFENLTEAVTLVPCMHKINQKAAETLFGPMQPGRNEFFEKKCPNCMKAVSSYHVDPMVREIANIIFGLGSDTHKKAKFVFSQEDYVSCKDWVSFKMKLDQDKNGMLFLKNNSPDFPIPTICFILGSKKGRILLQDMSKTNLISLKSLMEEFSLKFDQNGKYNHRFKEYVVEAADLLNIFKFLDYHCEFPGEVYPLLKKVFGDEQNPNCQYTRRIAKTILGLPKEALLKVAEERERAKAEECEKNKMDIGNSKAKLVQNGKWPSLEKVRNSKYGDFDISFTNDNPDLSISQMIVSIDDKYKCSLHITYSEKNFKIFKTSAEEFGIRLPKPKHGLGSTLAMINKAAFNLFKFIDHTCEFPEESYTELKEIFGNVQNPSCQYKYSLRKMLTGGLV